MARLGEDQNKSGDWPSNVPPEDWDRFAASDVAAGFEIGPDLAAELRRLDLAAALAEAPESCRIQVLRVGGMKVLPRDWKAAAGSLRERPGCEVRIVRAKPFWGQIEYYEPEPVLNAVNAYCAEIFRE